MPTSLTHTLASSLLALALAQSLLLAVALLLVRREGGARRPGQGLLAALVLLLAVFMAHAWLDLDGALHQAPRLQRLLGPLPLLMGPLLWLSLRRLLQQGPPLNRRSAWHGLPFALASLAWLPLLIWPPQLQAEGDSQALPGPLLVFGLFKAAHLAAYLFLSLRLLRQAGAALKQQEAAASAALQTSLVRSLAGLSFLLAGGLALAALLFLAENLGLALPLSSDLCAALAFTAFVHGLAFVAMRLPLGYQPPLAPRSESTPPRPKTPPRLNPDEREQSLARLQASMTQEQRFREGELSLEQLAAHLALTPAELSQLINQSCGLNFQEFLNGHRVEALKLSMRAPENRDKAILDLALEAGFNSKSSLNRVFKKHTGLTPSQYREGAEPP
ncbi:helix-turn-helix transcriptional regulator [Paucibacter sp. DJ1R-11]|uniref:helix-turn-helix transcriptional regulator n=1 Tax=Paucibacter sp. DJ1R-11 TaxID=2893556 RepID=UPI0021E3EC00|nr:helix-turn-helix transcriptional regulator [Paucibacter sp. DJ1R-11]MCV2364885.1 helix-turn-helix transcriptional regulator [Paucibacter sp. DJ1R-11]